MLRPDLFSTLKVLTGVNLPDIGELYFEGEKEQMWKWGTTLIKEKKICGY